MRGKVEASQGYQCAPQLTIRLQRNDGVLWMRLQNLSASAEPSRYAAAAYTPRFLDL
jgi:hypothetical protein